MHSTVKIMVPAVLAATLVLAPMPASIASTQPEQTAPRTVRISIGSAGEPNDISGRSSAPDVDNTGKVVAFDSIATNLVRRDSNRSTDVFVRDRTTDKTTRVSVSSTGVQANDDSTRPSVSGDGIQVAFDSGATNLVAGDTNKLTDVFVHNRTTRETILVSIGLDGTPGNGTSFAPAVTQVGRHVAFASDATNLVSTTVPEFDRQVYLRDLATGRTELVSLTTTGEPAGRAAPPAVSRDARYVAFGSFADDVVPGDTNGNFDVFVRDRKLDTTTRVSVASGGVQAEGGGSYYPSISADGRFVAFGSDATNLVPDDTNGVQDIFVHDGKTGVTERVSVGPGGVEGNGQSNGPGIRGGTAFGPSISADGRYVTFDSIATNLVVDDTNTCSFSGGPSFSEPGQCPDIFVRDRSLDVTTRVSTSSAGAQSNDASTDPSISFDGTSVAFFTTASNLGPVDTNTCPPFFFGHPGQCPDIYLHRR